MNSLAISMLVFSYCMTGLDRLGFAFNDLTGSRYDAILERYRLIRDRYPSHNHI